MADDLASFRDVGGLEHWYLSFSFFPVPSCASLPMGAWENTQPVWLWPESRRSASSGKKRFTSIFMCLSISPSICPSLHSSTHIPVFTRLLLLASYAAWYQAFWDEWDRWGHCPHPLLRNEWSVDQSFSSSSSASPTPTPRAWQSWPRSRSSSFPVV